MAGHNLMQAGIASDFRISLRKDLEKCMVEVEGGEFLPIR